MRNDHEMFPINIGIGGRAVVLYRSREPEGPTPRLVSCPWSWPSSTADCTSCPSDVAGWLRPDSWDDEPVTPAGQEPLPPLCACITNNRVHECVGFNVISTSSVITEFLSITCTGTDNGTGIASWQNSPFLMSFCLRVVPRFGWQCKHKQTTGSV